MYQTTQKKPKRLYKIRDKKTGKYISCGYNSKATWLTFPGAAIESSININDRHLYEVDMFEMVKTSSFTLDHKPL